MKCHLTTSCLLLFPSVTLAAEIAPPTDFELVFGEPPFTECDPVVAYSGRMNAGDVGIVHRVATDASAVLVIFSSGSLSHAVGSPPLDTQLLQGLGVREELRVINGLLVGPVGVANVLGVAVPGSVEGDDWALVIVGDLRFLADISWPGAPVRTGALRFLDGDSDPPIALVEDPPYDNPSPADFCPDSFLCNEYGNVQCGPDPYDNCSPNPQNTGILECWRAAGCRLSHCIWAVCITDRNCECDWYKDLCDQYYEVVGDYPPPWWAPGTPYLACGLDMPRNAACLAVYAAELVACVPMGCLPRAANANAR